MSLSIYTDEWSHRSRFFGERCDFGRRLSDDFRATSREGTEVCSVVKHFIKYIGEVLNCVSQQNMVGMVLFVFAKTCNYAI